MAVTRSFTFDFDNLIYFFSLLTYWDIDRKNDLMPFFRSNKSSWTVFHHSGYSEFEGRIDIIRKVFAGTDIWDGVRCLTFFCKIKSSYPLYASPGLERHRSPGKVHYPIFCQELEKPSDYLDGRMRSAHCGLKALQFVNHFRTGLRDVSVTNLLPFCIRGKMSDFDYEQKSAACISSNICTGTRCHRAWEVDDEKYLFPSSNKQDPTTGGCATNERPFRFNPLHDLESVLWTAVWNVYKNCHRSPMPISYTAMVAQHDFTRGKFSEALFDGELSKPFFKPVVDIFDPLATRLISQYEEVESNPQVHEWDFSKCHDELIEVVQAALKTCRAQTMPTEELVGITQTETRKAGDGDDGDSNTLKN